MKATKLETIAKQLEPKERVRFPQTYVLKSFFEMLREEKEKRRITWEQFLAEAGVDWLRKRA